MFDFTWTQVAVLAIGAATGLALLFLYRFDNLKAHRDFLKVSVVGLNARIDKIATEQAKAGDNEDLREDFDEMNTRLQAVEQLGEAVNPNEAWLADKLKPVYERANLISKDVTDIKTQLAEMKRPANLRKGLGA